MLTSKFTDTSTLLRCSGVLTLRETLSMLFAFQIE